MEYKDYTSVDFAEDTYFVRWVMHDDAEAKWFWLSFLKAHPEKQPAIDEARRMVLALRVESKDLDTNSFQNIRDQIILSIKEDQAKGGSSKQSQTSWLKVAAIFLLPMAAGLLIFWFYYDSQPLPVADSAKVKVLHDEVRRNPPGQKSMLHLPDGTKVWLNADSKLEYDKDFDVSSTREVYLNGEAFFEVAHNASRPFIVHTTSIDIRVLGTAFNVKSYAADNTIETTLTRGKVSIQQEGNAKEIVLKPSERAVFSKETRVIDVSSVNVAKASAWRYDKLVFDEVSFQDVIAQLERWYDVKIHVAQDTKLDCKLTAEIESETLEDVLSMLALSHNLSYDVKGKEIFIQGHLCN